MITFALFSLAACLTIAPGADSIRASDLTPGYPEMAALPTGTAVAPAPLPGVPRVFGPAELRRLAALYHLPAAPQKGICITRPVAPLDPERLLEAMRSEWPEARIELLDFSREPAPEGAIHFPRNGLHAGLAVSPGAALWTGWVEYGGNRRFSIWTRVKMAVKVERVVAIRDLRPLQPIAGVDVQLVEREEIPGGAPLSPAASALDQVVGKWPRQPIHTGESVRAAWLEEPKVVLRGKRVKVTVHNGGAQLELDGLAEASGAIGETVLVRNPDSGRCFRARVEAEGRVTVDAAGVKP